MFTNASGKVSIGLINVSLCDTIYCTTSLYFVQLTMDDGSSETCLV